MRLQSEDKFWHTIYLYTPIALAGIFFLGPAITPSYYTLIFLGIAPFLFLLWNKNIPLGDVKKSFLCSLPLLWPFVYEIVSGWYNYGSYVLSRWQWPADPSTLSSWGIFDRYLWHPFVIFSFSMNFFFLCVVQTTLKKHIKPGWSILTTTGVWMLFFLSFMWVDGSLPGNVQNLIVPVIELTSLFLICSCAFHRSGSIIGQVTLLGIALSLYL